MSLTKSRTWWSQRSLTQKNLSPDFIFSDSCQIVRKESILPDEKHTFFPGNELSGSRIRNSPKFILHSDSHIKILIEFILFATSLLLAIIVPYSISYFSDFPKGFYYTISLLFLIDIILSLNTSYHDKGKKVTNRKRIIKRYLSTWMAIDVIACFPSEIFISLDYHSNSPTVFILQTHYTRLFLLLKLLKILKFKVFFSNLSELSTGSFFFVFMKVTITLLYIIIPIHWMCCLSNMLYVLELDSTYAYWRTVKYTNLDRYLIILERIVETVTSVGFGEFTVVTKNERIFSIIIMLCTSGYFGLFVGHIEQIISSSNKVSNYFRRVKFRFIKMYDHHKFDKKLKTKVNNYIRHMIDTYNNHSIQDEDFIKLLSIPLREQIFLCTKGYVLITVPFFKNLSRPCIRAIGYKMLLRIYGPSDILFNEGEVIPELFFINSGTIQIFHSQSLTIFTELNKDRIFGELTFLLKQGRSASARSANFSELLVLNRFDIDEILLQMPKDSDKFLSVIWNLKQYGAACIGISCYLCGSIEHIARNCDGFIWKANPVRRKFQDFDKRVNAEYTPKRIRTRKNPILRYGVYNTTGRRVGNETMFKENAYLIKKANEFSRNLDFNRRNYMNVINVFEMDGKSVCESNNESEKNFLEFKYLEHSPTFLFRGASHCENQLFLKV